MMRLYLLDTLTDFRTDVSGVRAQDIKFTDHNAMELHACRKMVGDLLTNKILVGHSLKNAFGAATAKIETNIFNMYKILSEFLAKRRSSERMIASSQ
jgi:hypothetical protein